MTDAQQVVASSDGIDLISSEMSSDEEETFEIFTSCQIHIKIVLTVWVFSQKLCKQVVDNLFK